MVRRAYLTAAGVATELLADGAVAEKWNEPSVLERLTVGGLAAHLARQVVLLPSILAQDPPDERPLSLRDHFARSEWIGASLDAEPSRRVREGGQRDAERGPETVLADTRSALATLRENLLEQPADMVIRLPWAPWSLSLDDLLHTRLLELAVHCDDLAVSAGRATPEMPPEVIEPVLDLLCRVATMRHGQVAVLRALSRAERAPATIAAI